jgi:hypothetical protein
MVALLTVFCVAVVFAVAVVAVGYYVLRCCNWLRRKHCGNCDFCDDALCHCWKRGVKVDPDAKACKEYYKREKV